MLRPDVSRPRSIRIKKIRYEGWRGIQAVAERKAVVKHYLIKFAINIGNIDACESTKLVEVLLQTETSE